MNSGKAAWISCVCVCLCKFLDEAQFQVCDAQEYDGHAAQSHVILPHAPGGVIDALLRQKFLSSCTAGTDSALTLECKVNYRF